MRGKLLLFILSILFIGISGCDMIEYHPYDGRIKGERNINNKNIKRIEEANKGKKNIRFAFIGDTQRRNDETIDFVNHLNKRNDIDFVIHGGDVSDFGLTKEFTQGRDILNKLHVPYVVLLGNHDCLANGEEIFREVFGDENFSFLAGNTKFVCLNTNALEFDYSHPVPDFSFIEGELIDERIEYEKTVFVMHAPPFNEQFNNNVANVFHYSLNRFKKLQFCMNAHRHVYSTDDLFNDGIIYYGTPNIAKRQYLLFTLMPDDNYEYELVDF